uniref:Uncharacterized protein n=1 Tax=Cannabis sativa TaxID=3483 RepID=A0A803P5R5_CANSA
MTKKKRIVQKPVTQKLDHDDDTCTKDELEITEPLVKNDMRIAQVDLEEVNEQAANWNTTVICMVFGADPLMVVFEGFIKTI